MTGLSTNITEEQIEKLKLFFPEVVTEELLSLNQTDHFITETVIAKMIEMKPKRVIFLDKQFEGNYQLKTNTALQMRDASVEFRTI